MLGDDLTFVHCCCSHPDEFSMMADAGVSASLGVHCELNAQGMGDIPFDRLLAVGIRPNTKLAESMKLHCQRGIVVTDTLQTVTDPRIYAVGECANHRGIAYGLVAPLFEQGKVLANHLAELALLRALRERVPALALSMEQFERDVQPVVDDYLAGRIGEATLKHDGRAWSNYDEAYRPLVEYARDHALPVIAANAPAALVRCVGQKGAAFLQTLAAEKRGWAAAEIRTEDGPYKRKFLGLMNGDAAHGGVLSGARAESSFAAQVTRDETMADSIANFLHARPGARVVHITGAFHADGIGLITFV